MISPTTSPLSVIGTLEKPSLAAMVTSSSMVASAETVIMSGLGVITSRTSVSPNSRTESISSRSCSSASSEAENASPSDSSESAPGGGRWPSLRAGSQLSAARRIGRRSSGSMTPDLAGNEIADEEDRQAHDHCVANGGTEAGA